MPGSSGERYQVFFHNLKIIYLTEYILVVSMVCSQIQHNINKCLVAGKKTKKKLKVRGTAIAIHHSSFSAT